VFIDLLQSDIFNLSSAPSFTAKVNLGRVGVFLFEILSLSIPSTYFHLTTIQLPFLQSLFSFKNFINLQSVLHLLFTLTMNRRTMILTILALAILFVVAQISAAFWTVPQNFQSRHNENNNTAAAGAGASSSGGIGTGDPSTRTTTTTTTTTTGGTNDQDKDNKSRSNISIL